MRIVTKLLVAYLLAPLVSCSDEIANRELDASDGAAWHPPPAPGFDVPDQPPERVPCDRKAMVEVEGGIKVSIPSPCREYDIKRDLGRPTP